MQASDGARPRPRGVRAAIELLSEGLAIAAAVALATLALKGFLLPNGFLDGGVTGLAILVRLLTDWPVSGTLPVLSLPFLALAYRTVSRRIVVKSVVTIGTLALVLELTGAHAVTEDRLLAAVFGGLCLGLGIGIAVRSGAVLDGTELLGIFVNDRFGVGIGKVVLAFNVVLFSATAALLSVESAMYSVLTFLVAAEVTDVVVRGLEDFIGVTIVSRRSEQVQAAILGDLGAGLTLFEGRGGYGHHGAAGPQPIIQTVISRIDIRRLYALIDEHDPEAFVIEFDVHQVRGGVLRRYLTRGTLGALPRKLLGE